MSRSTKADHFAPAYLYDRVSWYGGTCSVTGIYGDVKTEQDPCDG